MILLFFFFIATLLNIKSKDGFSDKGSHDWCILLTCCTRRERDSPADTERRIDMHTTVIRDWLEKTSLPIYIIESAGYPFDEFRGTRLKVISFKQDKETTCSTQMESDSILYALRHSDIMSYRNILKVTCKYFLEGIEQRLQEQDPSCELYLQASHNDTSQNSELLGFKSSIAEKLFTSIRYAGKIIEYSLLDEKAKYSFCRFPVFKNIYKFPRGNGSVLDEL